MRSVANPELAALAKRLRDTVMGRARSAAMSREAIATVSASGRRTRWRDIIQSRGEAMRRLGIAI